MKPMIAAGILLIVLGAGALWYRQTYTERKPLLSIGRLQATLDREETYAFPPAVGIIALVAGAGLIVFAYTKRS